MVSKCSYPKHTSCGLVCQVHNHHFIGSMVVYNVENNTLVVNGQQRIVEKNTLGVVDGQQRLTTIMVFLCALRDAFQNLGETDRANGLQGFIERKNRDNKGMFVLQTESSFPYLQETILKQGTSELTLTPGREEEALAKAKEIFSQSITKKLKTIDDDPTVKESEKVPCKIKWLTSTRDVVLELSIILITLDNEEDAYLIFETLNTRGKDLTLSDLVKNLFTRHLKVEGDVDLAKIKWENVLNLILNSSVELSPDNFIVHSWQSRFEFVTKAKTFPRIRESITQKNAKEHLDDFIFDAECYRRIFEPSYGWDKNKSDVVKSLEAFKLFKLVQPTPALLSLVRAYRQKQIKLRMLMRALQAIENFHFSFTAVTSSRSSGGISSMYSAFGRKLFDASNSNVASAEIRSLVTKLRERIPPPNEFDAAFEQIIYTTTATSQRALVHYILRKVTEHECLPIVGESNELTLEHLVPQTEIGEKWPEQIVGQIGNLMLVDKATNEKLGTKPFAEKKKILLKRKYQIPKEFEDETKLTEELITRRTYAISERARAEIWKVS